MVSKKKHIKLGRKSIKLSILILEEILQDVNVGEHYSLLVSQKMLNLKQSYLKEEDQNLDEGLRISRENTKQHGAEQRYVLQTDGV